MHRIGLFEGSTLKTREYCAKGIPFIYGYRERGIKESFPYAFRVSANEEPIDLKKIITLPYKTEKIKDFGYSWGRFYKKASFVVTFTTPCFPSPKPLERVIVQFPDVRVKWSVRVK